MMMMIMFVNGEGGGGQFKVTGHRSLFYQYRKYPKHS